MWCWCQSREHGVFVHHLCVTRVVQLQGKKKREDDLMGDGDVNRDERKRRRAKHKRIVSKILHHFCREQLLGACRRPHAVQVKRVRQEKDAKRMAIGVPLSAIRLGRAAESKIKQDATKGKGAAADNSSARVKFSKSSEVFKQLVISSPPPQPPQQ